MDIANIANSNDAWDAIETIAGLSGHSKQDYLKVTNIQAYLYAAYNPFTRYYITRCTQGQGEKSFDSTTWEILKQLSTRELSGDMATTVVNMHTKEMTAKSARLFLRILKKDFRMGMGVKTINKVFPGLIPTHDVMLAKLFERGRTIYPCFGSPKIDGVRGSLKRGKFYSRGGHQYKGLEHLEEELSNIDRSEVIDGELTIPGESFQTSSGMIRSDAPSPEAIFSIFEVPSMKESFAERVVAMLDIEADRPHVVAVPHYLMIEEGQLYKFYDECRSTGYEGVVVKPYDYQYKGTRSYDWMKMKPKETADLVVQSIYEGKGKYEGMMGGVIVNFRGKPNRVGGGWTDQQRDYYYTYPDKIISVMIECEFMELTDEGNMRSARFKRFRPGKGGLFPR